MCRRSNAASYELAPNCVLRRASDEEVERIRKTLEKAIGDHDPFHKMTIACFPTALLLHTADEVGADAVRQKSRSIDSYCGPPSTATRTAAQTTYRFSQHVFDGVVRQASQKTVEATGAMFARARNTRLLSGLLLGRLSHFAGSVTNLKTSRARVASPAQGGDLLSRRQGEGFDAEELQQEGGFAARLRRSGKRGRQGESPLHGRHGATLRWRCFFSGAVALPANCNICVTIVGEWLLGSLSTYKTA